MVLSDILGWTLQCRSLQNLRQLSLSFQILHYPLSWSYLSIIGVSKSSYTSHTVVAAFPLPIAHSPVPDTHIYTHLRTHYSADDNMIPVTHLQVSVHHAHLMAVKHRLQDLLDAMTACKHQGAHVSLSSATVPCTGQGYLGQGGEKGGRGGGSPQTQSSCLPNMKKNFNSDSANAVQKWTTSAASHVSTSYICPSQIWHGKPIA